MSQTPMVATITKTSGPILVERAGQTLTLQQGDALHATDSIHTQNASIECLFTDGSKVLLGPQSILTVQEFIFSSEGSSCVLNLTAGTMRSITGEIIEQNPDTFKLITPKTTVNVCGTDFGIQINADASESYVIFSIDQGHNLVVAMHEGDTLSLTGAGQGALISAGELPAIQSHVFTPEEIYDFLGVLFDLTDRIDIEEAHRKLWEEENAKSEKPVSLLLEQNNLSSWATDTSFNFAISQANMGMVLSSRVNAGHVVKALALGTVTLADNIPAAGSSIPSISGESSYFADGDAYTDGTHTLKDNTFTITGNIVSGSVISGDTQTVTGGNIVSGNDIMSGGHISSGTVVGDAYSISGASTTVQAGRDSITLASKTGGNSIYGDAYEVKDGAIVKFGHDTITIQGDFSHTTIAGDAFSVSDASVHTWGNDSISVGHMTATTAHTTIYGDSSTSTEYGGADTITVLSMSASGFNAQGDQLKSSIYAGGGDDSITVGTLGENAFIYAENGSDTIKVNSFAGGTIDGGEGDDKIVVQNMSGGVIYGGLGEDSIDIQGFLQGNVYFTHSGEDSISLTVTSTTQDAANIHLGTAGDTTHITLSDAVENGKITLHDFDIDGRDGSRDYLYDAAGNPIDVTQADLDSGSKDVTLDGGTLTIYFS